MSTIALLDGYNLLYRFFYAVPPFTASDGTPVNAVYGLARLLVGLHSDERPDLLYCTFDSRSAVRSALYSEYKATRDRMPDALRAQEILVAELLEAFGIPLLRIEGYEADDIIGTLVRRYVTDPDNRIWILSGDKDLLQFVSDRVIVYDAGKKQLFGPAHTIEKFGVKSSQIVDYLAIVGDVSDNIPWIPWFGPKKAQDLLSRFGTLDGIYTHLDDVTLKVRETLETYREQAFLSQTLARIDTQVPLGDFSEESYRFASRDIRTKAVLDCFRRYGFRSLLPRQEERGFTSLGIAIEDIEDGARLSTWLDTLAWPVSITTYTRDHIPLAGLIVYTGGDTAYRVGTSVEGFFRLLDWLNARDDDTIGYDIKNDLRRIAKYRVQVSNVSISDESGQTVLWI